MVFTITPVAVLQLQIMSVGFAGHNKRLTMTMASSLSAAFCRNVLVLCGLLQDRRLI
jgi:hypothetical protein